MPLCFNQRLHDCCGALFVPTSLTRGYLGRVRRSYWPSFFCLFGNHCRNEEIRIWVVGKGNVAYILGDWMVRCMTLYTFFSWTQYMHERLSGAHLFYTATCVLISVFLYFHGWTFGVLRHARGIHSEKKENTVLEGAAPNKASSVSICTILSNMNQAPNDGYTPVVPQQCYLGHSMYWY